MAPSPTTKPKFDERAHLAKWLRIWVGVLTVVTLVVVAYLTFITNSLADVNGNLGVVSRQVGGVGTNTVELPSSVDRINDSLSKIDTSLKPIPGQAGVIVGALTSINDKLGQTDASLQQVASTLQATLGGADAIAATLVDADEPGDNLGVQDIHQRVARINGRDSAAVGSASAGGTPGPFGSAAANLATIQGDSRAIVGRLDSVNTDLAGTCNSLILKVTGLLAGGGCSA